MEFVRGSLDEYYYLVIKRDEAYNAYCKVRDQHPTYQALEKSRQEFRDKNKDNWEDRYKALKVAMVLWDCEEKQLPEHRKWVESIFKVVNHMLHLEDMNRLQMAKKWFENKY